MYAWQVDLARILNTGLFSLKDAQTMPGWYQVYMYVCMCVCVYADTQAMPDCYAAPPSLSGWYESTHPLAFPLSMPCTHTTLTVVVR